MDDDFLRRLYGPELPKMVALTFAVTLGLGLWLYAMRGSPDGLFSSPLGVAGVAVGAAVGQIIAGLVVRRHFRR